MAIKRQDIKWDNCWKNGEVYCTPAAQFFAEEYLKPLHLKDKCVLEIGCGDLNYAPQVIEAKNYVGLDIAITPLLNAARYEGVSTLIVGDASRLPLGNGTFDTIISFQTLTLAGEMILDVISEASRVLRLDGRFVFDVSHSDIFASHPAEIKWVGSSAVMLYPDIHRATFDERGIKIMLNENGFDIAEMHVSTNPELDNAITSRFYPSDPREDETDKTKAHILVEAVRV